MVFPSVISQQIPQSNLANLKCQELNQQEQDSSSDSDEVIALDSPIDIDFPEETFHSRQLAQQDPYQEQEHERQQQQQEASPVPIVVSDIVTNSAANLHLQTAFPPALRPLAPKPSKVKMKTGHKGSKRPREPTNPGVWKISRRPLLCSIESMCPRLTSKIQLLAQPEKEKGQQA